MIRSMRPALVACLVAAVVSPSSAPAAPAIKPIQPGAEVQIGLNLCTLNFVFRSGSTRYIGTAGHCASTTGLRAVTEGLEFGTVVYTRNDNVLDFALIRIDNGDLDQVSNAVRHWGGPSGVTATADVGTLDMLNFYGYGFVVGSLAETRPRQGVLVTYGSTHFQMDGPAVNGDSGGPVLHAETGRALGIISQYGLNETIPTTDYGPTMSHITTMLASAGYTLTLQTASYPG